jgi:hypothetical protein
MAAETGEEAKVTLNGHVSLISFFCLPRSGKRKAGAERMQRIKLYNVNLIKVKGNGNITCPECGIGISPDDTSEEVYTILEPVMKGNQLQKIIIRCNRCKSTINLTGFNTLNKEPNAQN